MLKLVRRWWKYLTAKLTGSFNERADPKIQLEQAIAEAQEQHTRLKEQAANVIAIQKQTELQLNRKLDELESEAHLAAAAPTLRRHVVIVPVDKLDNSVARALQYARTLMPDEIRGVHASVGNRAARELADAWSRLGLSRIPLEIVDCSDRRINRVFVEAVAEEVADGDTEVSILIPQRKYRKVWHTLLHDSTSTAIASALSTLPHANVTFVPYHLGRPDVVDRRMPVVVSDDER